VGAHTVRSAPSSLARELIRAHFSVSAGVLAVDGVPVDELTRIYGSPLYVYSATVMERRYLALRHALARFADVFYSIKANPNPAVSKILVDLGAGLEIASGSELLLALSAGATPRRIVFAGPGKRDDELRLAIEHDIGEIHLESFEEIERLGALAAAAGKDVTVSVRVNPTAAAQGGAMRMGGKPAAFGFDEERIDDVLSALAGQPRLALCGVHLFAGTQVLDADVLVTQWSHGLDVAEAVGERIGRPLTSIDLGGGLGIPYHSGDPELDLHRIASGAERLADRAEASRWLADGAVMIEPGRYLSGPAGVYLMTVLAVKQSRGQRFVITDGGMHHHLAASGNLGQVIKRDYPVVVATRMNDPEQGAASVVGPLCTPLDTLARQAALPDVRPGDVIAVLQSGAYGLSASPVGFLGHPMPAEVLVDRGSHRCIRTRGSFEQPMSNLV
jgi:diaminopimelate decarboxylase